MHNLHRYKIVALIGLLLLPLFTKAQKNLTSIDNKKLHFGILVGYNSSRFTIIHSPEFAFHDSIRVVESPNAAGFNVGIISNLRLSKRFDLRVIPTISLVERTIRFNELRDDGNFNDLDNIVESIFLDVPIGVKYKSDRFVDNMRFYVLGGGKVGWDVASNSKKREANDILKLAPIDLGIEYGFGFEFYFPYFMFTPEIKITQGIRNVHQPTDGLQYSDVIQQLRSRVLTFSLQFEG